MRRKTIDELLEESRRRLERVEPEQAFEAMHAGALLIDLRSHDERDRNGVVPGSLHIPRSVLEWRVDPDSAHRNPAVDGLDQRLILFCSEGFSSSLAAATLHELGFENATDIIGGFAAWRAASLPVRPASAAPTAALLPGMNPPEPLEEP